MRQRHRELSFPVECEGFRARQVEFTCSGLPYTAEEKQKRLNDHMHGAYLESSDAAGERDHENEDVWKSRSLRTEPSSLKAVWNFSHTNARLP
jgi:hypothetical protein